MKLLITRPKEDAEPLAAELRQQGFDTQIEPLLSIEPVRDPQCDLNGVQALLVTSANGVRMFAVTFAERNLPVYAVGDASARAAREAGFVFVDSAEGDVDALAERIKACLSRDKGDVLHVAGSKIAGDLGGQLTRAGFGYRRAVLYQAEKVGSLSSEAMKAIRSGEIDGIVLFSPRTAEQLVNLVKKAGLEKACRGISAFCLSKAVADKASELRWEEVIVAEKPERESLMQALAERH